MDFTTVIISVYEKPYQKKESKYDTAVNNGFHWKPVQKVDKREKDNNTQK